MEEEKPILFGGEPHEYIIPALYPSVDEFRKSLNAEEYKDLDKEGLAKDFYERLALAKALKEEPSFTRNGILDNLLLDDEDNLEEGLVRDANTFFYLDKPVKSIDELTDDQKNFLYGRRMQVLQSPTYEQLKDYLYSRYNPLGRAEEEKWKNNANPIIPQNTSPSRQHSLGMTGQQIDPRYPLFLQVPNPHIPWSADHPLRNMYRESIGGSNIPPEQIERQLKHMDDIAKGDFLLESYEPFWNADSDKYPVLNRHLRSMHERNNLAMGVYPQFYQEKEYLPYFNKFDNYNPFEQKIVDLFNKK